MIQRRLQVGADDVLHRHIKDRYGDGRFDERRKPRADGRKIVSGTDQGHRMPHSKCRDHGYERCDPAKRDDQTEQKQQMVDAAQNMLDTEPDEPDRRLVPCRIKRHAAGAAGDHHRPSGFAERDIANSQLGVIPEVGGDASSVSKKRIWARRSDRRNGRPDSPARKAMTVSGASGSATCATA